MTGIYQITNCINGHSYIGQSRQIFKRWDNHKIAATNCNDKGFNYPLYRAIRKYGIENFKFEILEECLVDSLNDREIYWVNLYKPEYNQTPAGNYTSVSQQLTYEQVKEIQQLLINYNENSLTHEALGRLYNVSGKDTIRDINVGRTWHDDNLQYPLHLSKHDGFRKTVNTEQCFGCGKNIVANQTHLCLNCFNQTKETKRDLITREEFKQKIRTMPFVAIGKEFQVSHTTIAKWCIKFGLPSRKKDIALISDEEWSNI